jgi:hypothetical protein
MPIGVISTTMLLQLAFLQAKGEYSKANKLKIQFVAVL